ncbi:MAG: cache domain-containing protein [Candidatus Competibacter sp.]|nr:cache domain-containing protein [Candidatus Competibacter sp.]
MYISGYQIERDWRQNANQNLTLAANGLVGKANGWIDMNLRVLRENAVLPDIASMDAARQKPVLKAIQNSYEWAYLVFTVNRDGQNIGRSDDEPPQKFKYGDRSYFKQVLEGKPLGQEVVIGRTTQKPALIMAGPIQDGGNPIRGVLALAMHLVDVSQVVTGARIGKTGFAILVDENNKVIAHGKPEQVAQALQDLSGHPALRNPESAQAPIIYEDAGKRIVAFTQKTSLGWTLHGGVGQLPVTGDPASRRTLTDRAKAVLEQELMEFIGPMAAIVCEETWGSVSEMEAALEVLGRELPDPGQVVRFRQNVLKRLA